MNDAGGRWDWWSEPEGNAMVDLRRVMGWRLASVELPEVNPDDGQPKIVLVACESIEPVWLGYCENEVWYDVDGVRLPVVTAWMDLPKPPEVD